MATSFSFDSSSRRGWSPFATLHDTPLIETGALESPQQRQAGLLAGLMQSPARIDPKFFYDTQGCALYGAICQLQEYYPVRLESAIFRCYRQDIAALLPNHCLWVDLGCGDGSKSWPWLEAVDAAGYLGVDIAEDWLAQTLQAGAERFPDLTFSGVVTDFSQAPLLRAVLDHWLDQPPVLFYPGSSIGNFAPADALALLQALRQHLGPNGRLLIGVDAPKDEAMLRAAYDDALGVTAAFNRNVLRVANHELGCNFEPTDFSHHAQFNRKASRIEMRLVARRPVTVQLGSSTRQFATGDAIVTEHSYKYTVERFAELLHEAGYGGLRHWSDDTGHYHVFVAAAAPMHA
ncbi:L-histidine N(alpha)-methyltransferase [Chitinolyticbacter meiyuanensis]|uniref:L-histidine N(alpha)-methyltransferase n=1 Tax=Chitinolyticbacter meiyuanensis TaxID=682798 RepID=UPI001652A7B7|nr:L-histidine N(alpha)-methyltransferase [Chitinolyticbacter meiyuanensis]